MKQNKKEIRRFDGFLLWRRLQIVRDPLSLYLKSTVAAGADHGVFSLCLGETKNRPTLRTFVIDVGLSVAEFVASELEKSAKSFVFSASLLNVAGEHTEEDGDDQREVGNGVKEPKSHGKGGIGNKQGDHRVDDHENDIGPEQGFIQRIRAVPSVHEAVERIFDLSHNVMNLCPEQAQGRAFLLVMIIRSEALRRGPSWKPLLRGSVLR